MVITKQGKTIFHLSVDKTKIKNDIKGDTEEYNIANEKVKNLYELFSSYEADCAADNDLLEIRTPI